MNILRFFRTGRTGAGERSRTRRSRKIRPDCEWLEECAFLSADTVSVSITGITAHTDLDVLSVSSTSPTGLTPEQILEAYGISRITFSSGTVSGDGAGQTIAIIDAYDDPDIASDLAEFDAEFGISAPPSFTVDNLGATTIDAGWALETALDVEWAHAIAPDANIVLVEAPSDSLSDLLDAVSYASNLAGVSVVSMSWGTSEFSSETQYDSVFTTPSGHVNITYVAASGDTGAADGVEYPSASPDVLSVGGTTLDVSPDGTYISESAWSGSTGGFSLYESEPSYQTSTLESVGLSDGVRTTPDVAFNADPDTGVSVYDSIAYDSESGWFVIGGTSAAAPAWAGLIAIADQGLATGGVGTLSTTEALTDLYSLPSSDFNDITTGSIGYSATAGYDLVTGLGTPRADSLIAGLLADSGVSEGSTNTTGSSGSSTSSTSSSGTTTTTSPASTSHHKKDVSTTKTKTHHTKVERTRVEKTRTVRT
jgi:subtilase family serine protease